MERQRTKSELCTIWNCRISALPCTLCGEGGGKQNGEGKTELLYLGTVRLGEHTPEQTRLPPIVPRNSFLVFKTAPPFPGSRISVN